MLPHVFIHLFIKISSHRNVELLPDTWANHLQKQIEIPQTHVHSVHVACNYVNK